MFDSLDTCPETFLLWFHRCSWDYKLKSGKTLWAGLCEKYQEGRAAGRGDAVNVAVAGGEDRPAAPREVAERLAIQVADASKWSERSCATSRRSAKADRRLLKSEC